MTKPKIPAIKNPVDGLLQHISKAVMDWESVNTPEEIKERTHSLLNKNCDEIVLKLLGFDTRYGQGFQLDHCNGRSGNSIAGDYIRNLQGEAIKDWLGKVKMPTMSVALKKSFESSMREAYTQELRRHVYTLVQQKAEEDAEELLKQLTCTETQDNYIKALNLIKQTP